MKEGASRLYEFLRHLAKNDYTTEREFLTKELPTFVSILGYLESQTFYEVGYRRIGNLSVRADAVISTERTNSPWIIIEARLRKRKLAGYDLNGWKKQLLTYKMVSEAKYAILLEPSILFLLDDKSLYEYELSTISANQALEIYQILKCSPNFSNILPVNSEAPETTATLQFENFSLNLPEYLRCLGSVRNAETNDEKKTSFETLAKLLFDGIPFLSCRNLDLRTASSEIDIVIEYCGWNKPTMFDGLGRFCLVECKNWKSSVGAKHVRDFKGKLDKTRLRLGILFARNGITGIDKGADALREIRSIFDRDNVYILVIAEEDLIEIGNGANFYELLDKKMFSLRFDILSTDF